MTVDGQIDSNTISPELRVWGRNIAHLIALGWIETAAREMAAAATSSPHGVQNLMFLYIDAALDAQAPGWHPTNNPATSCVVTYGKTDDGTLTVTGQDDTPPEVIWAGRFVDARARGDREAWHQTCLDLPEDLAPGVLFTLAASAVTLNRRRLLSSLMCYTSHLMAEDPDYPGQFDARVRAARDE